MFARKVLRRVLLFDKLKNDASLLRLKFFGAWTERNNEISRGKKPTKTFNHRFTNHFGTTLTGYCKKFLLVGVFSRLLYLYMFCKKNLLYLCGFLLIVVRLHHYILYRYNHHNENSNNNINSAEKSGRKD